MRVLLILIFSILFLQGQAQDKLDFGDTPITNTSPKYKSNNRDYKSKRLVEWVKNSPEGLLLGNPCMEEVRQQMGFVYIVQTKRQARSKEGMKGFGLFWHNLKAKLKITLRNGPFWRFKLKRKRKECRSMTSDYVG